jgi:hypothetical protein
MMTLQRISGAAVLIALLLLSFACSATRSLYKKALKEYRRGDYETSLHSNVQALERKASYAKAQKLIKRTYPKVLEDREDRIRKLEADANEDMWDQLVLEYTTLVGLQSLIKPIDPLTDPKTGEEYYFDFRDYEARLANSKESAALAHYQRALNLALGSDDPDDQRQAYNEFQKALEYVPNFRDASQRSMLARQKAVKRIAILAFEDKSNTRERYGGVIDLLTESIIGKLVQDRQIREYVDIVSRDQISALVSEQQFGETPNEETATVEELGGMLGAHEIMTGKIIQINYIAPRTNYVDLKETKNMVTGKEKYVDDKGREKMREVREDVTCVYRKYSKTTSVKVISSFSLIEVNTGIIKLQEPATADYSWTDTWIRVVSGDERALSDATLSQVSKEEPFPPSELDMVNYALEDMSGEIAYKVREYVTQQN